MNKKTPTTADLVAEYLARGGKVTQCPPGGARDALTVEGWRQQHLEDPLRVYPKRKHRLPVFSLDMAAAMIDRGLIIEK